jgi:hypothetical protein
MAMNNSRGVKFEPSAAKRVIEASRFVEQQPRSKVSPGSGPADFGGAVILLVTVPLNPMVGAIPGGNGRGKIQQLSGATGYTDLSTTVYPIVNDTEKTVAVGAYLLCCSAYGAWHWLGVDKCAHLS